MEQKIYTAFQEYKNVLALQDFKEETLDYSILKKHKPFLDQLGAVANSSISVFDYYQKKYVYISSNFDYTYGFDTQKALEGEWKDYFDIKIHPDDLYRLVTNGIQLLHLSFQLSDREIKELKLINEYRIKNGIGNYVRVIEQHQILELDKKGNIWLTLGVMDISPNQNIREPLKSRLLNFKTGELFNIPILTSNGEIPNLSKREVQILGLLSEGLISKEIADKLFISVHTVNTHRQRIISKLKVTNITEAVSYANNLGLLE